MKVCIIEVRASITDDGPKISISRGDVPHDELKHLLMGVCPVGIASTHLDT